MHSRGPIRTVLAGSLLFSVHASAGTIIFRSAPAFYSAPVFRPAPTFSAPTFRAPAYRPSYGTGAIVRSPPTLGSAPSYSRSSEFGRLNTFSPSNPWAGMPPQIRNRPLFEPQQAQQPLATRSVSNAETELLSKLNVPLQSSRSIQILAPNAGQLIQRTATATQAENQLLTQLHVSASPSPLTVSAPSQAIVSAKTSEDTLLKQLEVSAPTTTQTHTPTAEPNTTIVTIIPGKGQSPGASPTNPAPGQTSQIVTVIPANKIDTTVAGPLTTGAPSPAYTFSPTSYGTIQVFENGKLIGTGTASFAQQYGYQPPSLSTPTSIASANPLPSPVPQQTQGPTQTPITQVPAQSSITALQGASASTKVNPAAPTPGAVLMSNQGTLTAAPAQASTNSSPLTTAANGANALSNFYQSNPGGQTLLDTLGTAGGSISKVPGLAALGNVDEAITLTTLLEQKNYAAIPANLTSFVGSNLAAAAPGALLSAAPAYAAPLASATFVASFDIGQHTIAPILGPPLGGAIFNLDPKIWTPGATPNITVIPTTNWTGVQVPPTGTFSLPGP
jgi:hypothetical protein